MNRTSPSPAPKRAAQRGVVLLEVLVAILIFSFGILGTVGLLARATQFSTNAEDRNRAALLANDLAAQMVAERNLRVDTTSWRARVADVTAGGLPNSGSSGVVVATDPLIGAEAATITVTWSPASARAGDPANRFATQVVLP